MSYHFFAMLCDFNNRNGHYFGHVREDDPETFYHGWGPSRMSMPPEGEYEIIFDYGLYNSIDDGPEMRAVELRHALDLPVKKGMKASAGWISPEGNFYPCGGWEHDEKAYFLALQIYGFEYFDHSGTGTMMLEERGWIRLYNDGLAYKQDNRDLSQSQIDTLFDIAMEYPAGKIRDKLLRRIEDG